MSNFDDYSEDDFMEQESNNGGNPVRQRMKQLEKENRETKKLLAELQSQAKELEFVKAGVDTADPKFKYFVKAYDGEMTSEAIKEALVEAQLIAPPQQVDDTDKQAWRETNKIAAGSEVSPAPPGWIDRINGANSESELMSIFAEAQAQGIDLGEM